MTDLVGREREVGVASLVGPDGPLSIVVSGAAVSTVKLRDAGVASTFPAASVARTSKVCAPSASDAVVSGVEHEPHAPPSTRHSKLEPGWSAENANVGVASFVGPDGPLSIVVSGAAVSTVKLRDAGVGSTLPAGSVARTSKVWAPSASDVVVSGVVHEPQAPPSTRQSKLEPGWLAEKANVGVVSFVGPEGPLSIVVCGAAVSTVKLREAGVASTFPARSVARTSNVCAPSASDPVVSGVEHEPHAPPSTRHSNVEPASSAENANVGVASFVGPDGPLSIVVSGAAVSTVKLRDAGVGSTLPAGSVARTSNVWAPSACRAVVWAELQEAQAPPSTRHSNVEPGWSAEKVYVGVASLVGPEGPLSIVVSGAAVSTVKLRDAGVASTLPAGSVARTSKVCAPSASDAVVSGVEHAAPRAAVDSALEARARLVRREPNVGVASLVGPDGPLSIVSEARPCRP